MSAHTKMHHTKAHTLSVPLLYFIYKHKKYAIPQNVVEKYIVDEDNDKNFFPAEVIFEKLEKKLTKAGALLKGLRTREGLSQIAFAKKIAVTQANLSNMENGRRPIGKIVAKRIEKIFGVDYRYFLE